MKECLCTRVKVPCHCQSGRTEKLAVLIPVPAFGLATAAGDVALAAALPRTGGSGGEQSGETPSSLHLAVYLCTHSTASGRYHACLVPPYHIQHSTDRVKEEPTPQLRKHLPFP